MPLTISSSTQTIALTRIPPLPNTSSLRSLQLRISRPKPTPTLKLISEPHRRSQVELFGSPHVVLASCILLKALT
jgi:hypothetical protein